MHISKFVKTELKEYKKKMVDKIGVMKCHLCGEKIDYNETSMCWCQTGYGT